MSYDEAAKTKKDLLRRKLPKRDLKSPQMIQKIQKSKEKKKFFAKKEKDKKTRRLKN